MEEVLNKALHKDIIDDGNTEARIDYLKLFARQPEIEYLVYRLTDEIVFPENNEIEDDGQFFIVPNATYLPKDAEKDAVSLFWEVMDAESFRDDEFGSARRAIRDYLVTGQMCSKVIRDENDKPVIVKWNSFGGYYISYIEKLIRTYNMIRQTENAFVIDRFDRKLGNIDVKTEILKREHRNKSVELSDAEKTLLSYLRDKFVQEAGIPTDFFSDWKLERDDSIIKDYEYYHLKNRIRMDFEIWVNKMIDCAAKKKGIVVKEMVPLTWLSK